MHLDEVLPRAVREAQQPPAGTPGTPESPQSPAPIAPTPETQPMPSSLDVLITD
jgi:hypothetical protein